VLATAHTLEPHIRDTSTVSREIFPTVQAVEVIHDHGAHNLRFRESEVDGDTTAIVLAGRAGTPIGDATAIRTKMKFKVPVTPGVCVRWARNPDTFIFIIIGPKHPVAATDGAVAGSSGIGDTFKAPTDGAAMTGTFDHFGRPFLSSLKRATRSRS
jgi:hypothetical protein